MANEINYDTKELEEARAILKESAGILQGEIDSALKSNFEPLTKVDLFSGGLSKLQSQAASLIENYNTFSSSLGEHDSDLAAFEDNQAAAAENYINSGGGGGGGSYSSGDSYDTEQVAVADQQDGQAINSENYLEEVLPQITYDSKLQALKNILAYNEDTLTAILSDPAKANILVYQLKSMLKQTGITKSELSTDDEKKIQKILLESICKEDKNPFAELDDSTYLTGMPYLKQLATSNNINFSDLIVEDKYASILMSGLSNIYNGNAGNTLTSKEVEKVKAYIDEIASINKMDAKTLLSNVNNVSLIKGGVKK